MLCCCSASHSPRRQSSKAWYGCWMSAAGWPWSYSRCAPLPFSPTEIREQEKRRTYVKGYSFVSAVILADAGVMRRTAYPRSDRLSPSTAMPASALRNSGCTLQRMSYVYFLKNQMIRNKSFGIKENWFIIAVSLHNNGAGSVLLKDVTSFILDF